MSSTVTRWHHRHPQPPLPWRSTSTTNIQLPSARLPPVTVTLTDVIYSTTQDATTTTTTHDLYAANSANNSNGNDLSHHLHQLLPVLGLFAVIGLLTVLSLLGYMAYRFYRSSNTRRRRNNDDMEWTSSSGREPMEFENSASELKAQYAPAAPWPAVMQQEKRPLRLDSPVENSEQPISSTFVPINTSPLTLVSRMEVWQDPQRRRGVDELDLWERKQQQKQQQPLQEDSPRSSSETVQPAIRQPASHIAMARKALEKSRLENSSSQWLRPSGSSRSL